MVSGDGGRGVVHERGGQGEGEVVGVEREGDMEIWAETGRRKGEEQRNGGKATRRFGKA